MGKRVLAKEDWLFGLSRAYGAILDDYWDPVLFFGVQLPYRERGQSDEGANYNVKDVFFVADGPIFDILR